MTEIDTCEERAISQIFRLLFKFFRNELSCKDADLPMVRNEIELNLIEFLHLSIFNRMLMLLAAEEVATK